MQCMQHVHQKALGIKPFLLKDGSPPRKGTLTSSILASALAAANPVIRGTYFKALDGPAQFDITNVRRLGKLKSRNGCRSVSLTHFRYRCFRWSMRGRCDISTLVRFRERMRALRDRLMRFVCRIGKVAPRFLKVPRISRWCSESVMASRRKMSHVSTP